MTGVTVATGHVTSVAENEGSSIAESSPSESSLAPTGSSMAGIRGAESGSAQWEMPGETGEATVRIPEQQAVERELSPEEQRIELVVQWLDEAEDADKLSGAEVARRLGVAPRTGQRDLRKARVLWSEQVRQQSRVRLRSVAASS